MEQQQCPICMLYLLPGMNLEEHLRTHPKDMIIKALLSVKPELMKPLPVNDVSNVYFTSISDFDTSTPFYFPALHTLSHSSNYNYSLTIPIRKICILCYFFLPHIYHKVFVVMIKLNSIFLPFECVFFSLRFLLTFFQQFALQ